MTDQKQRLRPLIEYKMAKPFIDAAALGAGCASFAFVSGAAPLNWALIGGGFSLVWSWGSGNVKMAGKRKPASRTIPLNGPNGSRNVRVFDQVMPGFITRESWLDAAWRFVVGSKPKPPLQPRRALIDKPSVLEEFVFMSSYDGYPVELLDSDVRRFLSLAWQHRANGSGLGARRWVRNWRQRPQWYQARGRVWYYSVLNLMHEAEYILSRQVVVRLSPDKYALAHDPHTIIGMLKWAEMHK